MKSDCIAFTAIPHTTDLFRDYLYNFERVQRFYPVNPRQRERLREYARDIHFDEQRRQSVADILERQNRAFGASAKALENIARFRAGALASVSGQQVGLLGGPLYSVLKAASAIRMARDLTAQGVDCVPVFWLATEDHDLAEVSHTTLLNLEGLPERLQTSSRGAKDAPVSEVRFGEEIIAVVERARALLGEGEAAELVAASYRPGESMGTAFGKLFAGLFAQFGLILLDPSDPALHAIAKPVYQAAIEKAGSLDAALLQRGRELREAGYHEQVKVTPESTLLFEMRDGARMPIHRVNGEVRSRPQGHGGVHQSAPVVMPQSETTSSFVVGREHYTSEQLLARIQAEPQRYSANVLLRPVVQDFLLPTAVYFGGAAEIAYFAQLEVVARSILQRATPILPRLSVTLVDARAQRLLEKYGIGITDLFAGPETTRELLASKSLPSDIMARFEQSSASVANGLRQLRQGLEKLDPTLGDAADNAQRKMLYQLDRLRKRAANAEARKNGEIARHAEWLSATLYPGKDLQEREIAGISFVARYGRDLLEELVSAAENCPDHQVLHL